MGLIPYVLATIFHKDSPVIVSRNTLDIHTKTGWQINFFTINYSTVLERVVFVEVERDIKA